MNFNEDKYRDQQLDKYLKEQEGYALVSNCCGVDVEDENSDICPKCKEHCEVILLADYDYDMYEQAMEDKADAEGDEALLDD